MQVKELKSEKLKKEFEICVPSKDMDTKLDDHMAKLAKEVRIDGFRPGKVPLQVVRQRYGAKAREEMLSETLQKITDDLVSEKKLRLAVRPNYDIKQEGEGKDFKFTVSFETLPEIKALKLDGLAFTHYSVKIDDKKVQDTLKTIAENNQDSEPLKAKRKTKKGDVLVMDFLGKVDGTAFEGGAAQGHKLELGSNSFIPGFEDQLIGCDVGKDVLVKVTFPKDYSKPLAGKDAEFEVKIHEIHEKKLPKIDDAFAQKLGLKDLGDMKKIITEKLAEEYAGMGHEYAKQDVLNVLSDQYSIDLPETMVENEYHSICHRLENHEGTKLSKDEFEKKRKEWKKEYYPIAERRVKLGLVLAEIAKGEGIRVGGKELEDAVMRQAHSMRGQEQQVIDYYKKNPQAVEQLRAPLLEEKVIAHILDKAKVTKKEVSFEEMSKMLEKREEEMENAYK